MSLSTMHSQHGSLVEEKETAIIHEENKDAESREEWTTAEERKLLWKVELRLLPMLCIVFGLSLLDRTNISAAYIAGLDKDISLTDGPRYNIALLVFFIGYAIFELPSNMIILRIGARYWLGFLITAWGCMVLGMGFVHDWKASDGL